MRAIFEVVQQSVVDGFRKSGPSATRVELVCRKEKRLTRGDINIYYHTKLVVEIVFERSLGGCILRQLVLQGRLFAFQFFIRRLGVDFLFTCFLVGFAGHVEQGLW